MLSRLLKNTRIFSPKQIIPSSNLVVVITGCDSGLGLLMAKTAHQKGLTVIAGVLQGLESDGAKNLKAIANSKVPLHIVELDVTKRNMVDNLKSFTEKLLENNKNSVLHAVVNNAGVMIMGDFEWQTRELAEKQWAVNVCGTWDVTRGLLWALRNTAKKGGRPRIINVNSHCGLQTLRTMTVYSATKAALRAWSEGLRMELKLCGVQVVDYIPGRVVASNILMNQTKYFEEMRNSLSTEQLNYYESYFNKYISYISAVGDAPKEDHRKYEKELEDKFVEALLDKTPCILYKTEPLRYVFYYNLFKIAPHRVKYWLMEKFLLLPSLKNIK